MEDLEARLNALEKEVKELETHIVNQEAMIRILDDRVFDLAAATANHIEKLREWARTLPKAGQRKQTR